MASHCKSLKTQGLTLFSSFSLEFYGDEEEGVKSCVRNQLQQHTVALDLTSAPGYSRIVEQLGMAHGALNDPGHFGVRG